MIDRTNNILHYRGMQIGGNRFTLIAGPCVIESSQHANYMAHELKKITDEYDINFIFKASFQKANRTSLHSYTGLGMYAGLDILLKIKKELKLITLTDVHEVHQVFPTSYHVDALQVPAMLMRQTDLLTEIGACNNSLVNIKKAQFCAPEDMKYPIEKITAQGNTNIMLCERGTCFGYHSLVVDYRSFNILSQYGYPVIFDCTHSTQNIGSGSTTSGNREFTPLLARAAVAAGCDGLFLECHDDLDNALSDSGCMIHLDSVKELIEDCLRIRQALY